MKMEMTFNDDAIKATGYQKEDIYYTIKKAFAKRGLICSSDNEVLSFVDTGKEDDYAHLWNTTKCLMISDWFLKCASSCTFIDDDNAAEDVLSQAYLFRKRSVV